MRDALQNSSPWLLTKDNTILGVKVLALRGRHTQTHAHIQIHMHAWTHTHLCTLAHRELLEECRGLGNGNRSCRDGPLWTLLPALSPSVLLKLFFYSEYAFLLF